MNKLKEKRNKEIITKYQNGESISSIAKDEKLSQASIYRILNENDIYISKEKKQHNGAFNAFKINEDTLHNIDNALNIKTFRTDIARKAIEDYIKHPFPLKTKTQKKVFTAFTLNMDDFQAFKQHCDKYGLSIYQGLNQVLQHYYN